MGYSLNDNTDKIRVACASKGTAAFEDFPDYDADEYSDDEEVLDFIATLRTRKLCISDMIEFSEYDYDNEPVTPTNMKIRDDAGGTDEASNISRNA